MVLVGYLTQRVATAAHLGHAHAGSRAATLAKLREVLSDARSFPARRAAWTTCTARLSPAHPPPTITACA